MIVGSLGSAAAARSSVATRAGEVAEPVLRPAERIDDEAVVGLQLGSARDQGLGRRRVLAAIKHRIAEIIQRRGFVGGQRQCLSQLGFGAHPVTGLFEAGAAQEMQHPVRLAVGRERNRTGVGLRRRPIALRLTLPVAKPRPGLGVGTRHPCRGSQRCLRLRTAAGIAEHLGPVGAGGGGERRAVGDAAIGTECRLPEAAARQHVAGDQPGRAVIGGEEGGDAREDDGERYRLVARQVGCQAGAHPGNTAARIAGERADALVRLEPGQRLHRDRVPGPVEQLHRGVAVARLGKRVRLADGEEIDARASAGAKLVIGRRGVAIPARGGEHVGARLRDIGFGESGHRCRIEPGQRLVGLAAPEQRPALDDGAEHCRIADVGDAGAQSVHVLPVAALQRILEPDQRNGRVALAGRCDLVGEGDGQLFIACCNRKLERALRNQDIARVALACRIGEPRRIEQPVVVGGEAAADIVARTDVAGTARRRLGGTGHDKQGEQEGGFHGVSLRDLAVKGKAAAGYRIASASRFILGVAALAFAVALTLPRYIFG